MEKEEEKVRPSTEPHDGTEGKGAAAMDEDDTAALSSPASLLQYVLRACAGCLMDICGGSDRGDRRPGADDSDAADGTSQRDDEEGSKATHDCPGAQLLARNVPRGRPGKPRPGRGGSHN